ncbi:MAG: 3-deoxy-D-manno-octulosonic acid transferase [Proteobacteria bacterium]|nr:3-deoxy-D-manno-octulosonic acid transferase [Pseudomonadota bacterium]
MMLALYRGLTTAAAPLIALYLAERRRRGKEDAARFPERLGIAGRARPRGPLVWAHAASVGESLSVLPLIERLGRTRPDLALLVTSGTVSSARVLERRLPAGALHQFVPVDRVPYVRRFLDHWRPDLALWLESEFWPVLLMETAARGVPLVLLNGRVSDRSWRRWRRLRGLIRPLLAGFALALGQSEADAARLAELGARHAASLGNLKAAAPPLPVDEAELARLRARLGARPAWLAASTHPGEEEVAARAHLRLRGELPGLLTLIVPRHPERGAAVAESLARLGLRTARRGAGESPGAETDAYVGDTLGELGLFFRLAGPAFVGGSLVPHGGQNPLEPARLGRAVLFGPHMENFRDPAAALLAAGGALGVEGEAGLIEALARLLRDPAACEGMAEAAARVAGSGAEVLERVLARLLPLLPPVAGEVARARA